LRLREKISGGEFAAVDKAPEAFRTISEVADELNVPKHVLRFWEAKFAQLKPMKRGGGRRYYRPEDVALLRGIRFLLYDDGYTIRGVQKILKEHGPRFVMEQRPHPADEAGGPRERAIPDVAAEAAQSRGLTRARGMEEQALDMDAESVGAVLEEIEACYRILLAART
jgi:DNA-binding transcriptional MerR regulator